MNLKKIKDSRATMLKFFQCVEKYGNKLNPFTAEYCYKKIFNVEDPPKEIERLQFMAEYHNLGREVQKIALQDIILPNEFCIGCGKKVLIGEPKEIVIYGRDGTVIGKRYSGRCRSCAITDFLTFHSREGKRHLNHNKSDIFISTEDTAFRLEFLETFEWELLLGCMSFRQKCAIYNCTHGYMFEIRTTIPNKRAR